MSSAAIDPIRLRIAEPADIGEIERIVNAAFRVEKFFIDGDRITAAELHTMMVKGRFLLALAGNGPAGCVYVEPREERAYLGLLSVDPSQQRRGIGSRLMTAAEDLARALGCSHMDLRIVNLRQELPEYYRRRGYMQTGTTPFPNDVMTKLPCHFIDMSKALD